MKEILKEIDIEVRSLEDERINIDVVEDGKTFEENAKKKAKEIYEYLLERKDSNFIVLADDSGLEVNYLNGEPGIYSARYAGEHGNDSKNNEKLLNKLKGVLKSNRELSLFVNWLCLQIRVSILKLPVKWKDIL